MKKDSKKRWHLRLFVGLVFLAASIYFASQALLDAPSNSPRGSVIRLSKLVLLHPFSAEIESENRPPERDSINQIPFRIIYNRRIGVLSVGAVSSYNITTFMIYKVVVTGGSMDDLLKMGSCCGMA